MTSERDSQIDRYVYGDAEGGQDGIAMKVKKEEIGFFLRFNSDNKNSQIVKERKGILADPMAAKLGWVTRLCGRRRALPSRMKSRRRITSHLLVR